MIANNSQLLLAHNVLEFGAGDGAFAHELLTEYLPAQSSYYGLELSERRVLAGNKRLAK